jgi:hypothetical protein
MAEGNPRDTDGMIIKLPKGAIRLLHEEADRRQMDAHDLLLSLIVTGWFTLLKDQDPRRAALLAQEFTNKDLGLGST